MNHKGFHIRTIPLVGQYAFENDKTTGIGWSESDCIQQIDEILGEIKCKPVLCERIQQKEERNEHKNRD